MWKALARLAKPAIWAYGCAPRPRACSSSSRTNIAAPSPSTNPLRLRSKGRAAVVGSSLRGVVARIASKHATVIGEIGASVAPATITSAVPSRIRSTACPTESRPEVQPVEIRLTGPSAQTPQATSAASELGTSALNRCGTPYSSDTYQLRPPSLTVAYSRSRLMVQPTALPTVTPTRPGSSVPKSSPLSSTHSRALTTASCAARSIRRTCCGDSPSAAGSKSHSAAICERNGAGSKKEIRRVAVRPVEITSQNCLAPVPPGATTPIPVITTRRFIRDHRTE